MKRRRVGEPGAAAVFRLGLRGDRDQAYPELKGAAHDIGSRPSPVSSEITYAEVWSDGERWKTRWKSAFGPAP